MGWGHRGHRAPGRRDPLVSQQRSGNGGGVGRGLCGAVSGGSLLPGGTAGKPRQLRNRLARCFGVHGDAGSCSRGEFVGMGAPRAAGPTWVAGQSSPVPKSHCGVWVAAGDAAPGPGCPSPPRRLPGSLGTALAWPDPALQHDLVYSSFLTCSRHGPFSCCQEAQGIWRPQTVSSCCAEGPLAAPRAPSAPCALAGAAAGHGTRPRRAPRAAPSPAQGSTAQVLFGQLLARLGLACDAVCCRAWGCVGWVMEPQVCVTRWHLLAAGHQNGESDACFWERRFPPCPSPSERRAGRWVCAKGQIWDPPNPSHAMVPELSLARSCACSPLS